MHSVSTARGLDYHIQVNAIGLRDRERTPTPEPGIQRVLFVGDSVVFGAGVEAADRMSDRLEAALGPAVEVVNAGVSGWGTGQEYLWFVHQGLALEPHVVVLGLCMLNDVINVMLPHELFGSAPKPRFTLDHGRLQLDLPPPRPGPSFRERCFEVARHSRLLVFVGRHLRMLRARLQEPPTAVADPTSASYYPENLQADWSHWSVFRDPYTPRFEAAFEVTEALVTAIRDSCAERGIPFVLFAIPNKVEVDPEARASELQHYAYDPSQFDLAKPYERLWELAERLGVPFVYPLHEFESAGEPLFFAHDGHPNAAGHAVAARSLEPAIRAALETVSGSWHATRP
jgi:lysophospholipase L1-like esterase